jgi:hypothetical protein
VFENADETIRILPAASATTRWMEIEGTVTRVHLHRATGWPSTCRRALASTPLTNYEVFWKTFAEQYAFFDIRGVDWIAVDRAARPRITANMKPEELFQLLSDMIAPLHDAHTFISAPLIRKQFRGRRQPTDSMQQADKPRIAQIIESDYLAGPLRKYCDGQIQFGLLRPTQDDRQVKTKRLSAGRVGYLRIQSFANYSADSVFAKQLDTLNAALDSIFSESDGLAGLVIDIRINSGGSDIFGLAMAARLTDRSYVAYVKRARDDPRRVGGWTRPQVVMVRPAQRPGFRGPVVLLTSAHGQSAAETFAMALLGRHPTVLRIGMNTQGVFSDDLQRSLPNGWTFGLSNEIYLTEDGKSFEGTGVPPDIRVPIFPKNDLEHGRDSGLDEALKVLVHGP